MLTHYLKIASRNLFRSRIFSSINIIGLAVGMGGCLVILQFAHFEMSYDRFHKNADRIYRVRHDRYLDGELQYQKAQAFIPTGQAMMDEFPEVTSYTTLFRISSEYDIVVSHTAKDGESIRFSEKDVYHVKGKFFELFSFQIIEGNRDIEALEPNTVMVSASTARRYFGEESPIGKTLSHSLAENYRIVGVFEDIPENAHMKFDFLFAWQEVTSPDSGGDDANWRWDGFYTYLLLAPEADAALLEGKFPAFIQKYNIGQVNKKASSVFVLQPLTSIHLHSDLLGEAGQNGDAKTVYTLLGVAVFVLIIAWINAINLSTARSLDRTKEIGVRKVIGSGKNEIIKQFLTESLVSNFLALVLACILVQLFYTYYAPYIGMSSSSYLMEAPFFWLAALLMLLMGSFVSGLYPAFVISSFKPVNAIKGNFSNAPTAPVFNIRNGLVVFQFVISIFLIAAALLVSKQLNFMKSGNLGLNLESALVVNTQVTSGDSLVSKNLSIFKEKMKGYAKVKGVTTSYDIPGKEYLTLMPNFRHSKNQEEFVSLHFTRIDPEFIPAFEIPLVAGRNFQEGLDGKFTMIMNVEGIKALGIDDPEEAIGYEVVWGNVNIGKAEIVGVVDFRSTSFKQHNYPVAFTSTVLPHKYVSISFNGNDIDEHIELVRSNWETVFPEVPFDYFFLDDLFNSHYQSERHFGRLLIIFTLLAIMVACSGLYAIAALTMLQKTKEVGVRKILGASLGSLMLLLSKKFFLFIILAGGLSLPIIHMLLREWLKNYPYQTALSWWIYLAPILAIFMISLLTIGHQVIRTSFINPSKLLRYE
ncbi:ABC transporter permease [Negadavirga shengliensis]|uniref:ABC transporter permease n=1 Tax=Negadavirga shengliensis TaxID=1389218 RepID=A0ABV9T6M1_9BACT